MALKKPSCTVGDAEGGPVVLLLRSLPAMLPTTVVLLATTDAFPDGVVEPDLKFDVVLKEATVCSFLINEAESVCAGESRDIP